jgi:NADH-quinone oxidoreductase subunit L
MPVTFATYAVGHDGALCVPLFLLRVLEQGRILHSAFAWNVSRWPFYLTAAGAVLTAFYMTRQMFYVFFGERRDTAARSHESPAVMTVPLIVLAAGTVLLGIIGTPAWPWFHSYLSGHAAHVQPVHLGVLAIMLLSTALVALGITAGGALRSIQNRKGRSSRRARNIAPDIFTLLRNKFWIDDALRQIDRFASTASQWASNWLDAMIWGGAVALLSYLFLASRGSIASSMEYVVNLGFDKGCGSVRGPRGLYPSSKTGSATLLRVLGFSVALLVIMFIWGCRR